MILFRTCALVLLCAITAIASPAQTLTTIYSFNSFAGNTPEALVQATNGNLYGGARLGGTNCRVRRELGIGCGSIFEITTGGVAKRLYNFCPGGDGDCNDAEPYSALVQAPNGNFYGTTAGNGEYGYGAGSVFEITPSGELTTLYMFCSVISTREACLDGNYAVGGLVQGIDGNFYGTTVGGGANFNASCNNFPLGGIDGCGTVFKITPSGTLTTIYNFCELSDCVDGAVPFATMIQGTDGSFYGTTLGGGPNCIAAGGCGTVFKITSSGELTTLYSFCSQSNCTDGDWPTALIRAPNGVIYGSTVYGGTSTSCPSGCGTIFRITPNGILTTLHSFDNTDGNDPSTPIQATDGNLYGTTSAGGANGQGTIYKITPNRTLTTLYNFCAQSGCPDGSAPVGILQDTNGNFYGTTLSGGTSDTCTGGCGTIYSLSVGLGPFVETQTTYGKAGSTVKILGTDLTGATSVTFNGIAAAFTVVASSEIKTTVPVGATTGTVQVITPSGTLSSNQEFRVTP
ncbi:MAG: choice-of-anchor tandem repeat GloVer-containing protein [Candidatus Sulfotelmatobacter sp.]